jgi:hypothetical protein
MKRYFTSYVLMLIAFPILLSAQFTPTPYKAKDGFESAKSKAAETITNPAIQIVGTKVGTLPGLPLPITMNLTNGEATAWIYKFVNPTDATKSTTVIIAKVAGVTTPIVIPDSVFAKYLPSQPTTSIPEAQWTVDSDSMVKSLTANNGYKSFMAANPTATISAVALFKIPNRPELPDVPFWSTMIEVTAGTQLGCITNASTGATICSNEVSVSDNENSNNPLVTYPNPATEVAFLKIPAELQSSSAVVSVFNTLGEKVWEYPNTISNVSIVALPLNMLSDGKYFIDYKFNGKSLTVPLVVKR